ncbi:MAG: DCC1-like thiol-disulfide oxidoreductase family protein [Actinobacteria bacterium]|nr:DCC1-like thiol-disulfide oxidoreductase family protein [Actinomycetota bacterium]
MSEIFVIYDGQCQLCINSIAWVSKKLVISPIDFHTGQLTRFGLSKEQCSHQVFVITDQGQFGGARGVALLLNHRGNRILSTLITLSGPLGRFAYKWVASNRNSVPVKILSRLLRS